MHYRTSVFSALAAFTVLAGLELRADNFVTITPTGASAATVVNRWAIGSGLSGLSYDDSNSGFAGATATNFFTITGAAIPPGGNPTGFTSYLPIGTATAQASVGNFLTPNSYAGLTYAANDLGFGALSFYAIHHSGTGDYVALIKPGAPTVTDIKAIPLPGGPLAPGGTGYFAMSYAAEDAGGWGANLFYFLRTDAVTGHTWLDSMIPALGSGPIDRVDLGLASIKGYTDLAYTSTDVGFGFGVNQFYYLRLDPVTQTTFLGRLNPLTGVATDIQNLGGVYRTLVFTPTNVGYGANNFYSIGQAAQTITFAPILNHTACDASFTLSPTASSGLAVTLAVTSGPATIVGNTVTLTGTGIVVLTASQAGNGSFAAAPNVSQSFAVAACSVPLTPQTITFAPLSSHTACDGPFSFVYPVATSGLPVTLAVSGPATVSGNTVTLTGVVGTVVLTASQAGNGTFAAAPNVTQSFVVAACAGAPTPQTITFASIPGHTACDAPFTFVAPVSSSGLPVTLAVSGPATVSGNTVTLTGTVGTVVLTASQAGNGTFAPASNVAQSFVVAACGVAPTPQTITFAAIPGHTACDAPFTFVAPVSSSGLPVTLAVSGPATVSGNTVTLTGTVGTVVITASQAGNGTFSAAPSVVQSFTVVACGVLPVITSPFDVQSGGQPVAPNVQGGMVGVTFAGYQITASGSPTSFGAINLPPGLAVNAITGAITGTPTVADIWFVTVLARNAAGVGDALVIFEFVPAGAAPVIGNGSLTTAGTQGAPFSYTIPATNSPTSFTATGLPAGLTLNALTGVISGTPTTAGTSVATVTATNPAGTGTALLTIVIPPAPSSRIVNFSARALSGPGNQALIMGFVVAGNGKGLLVRGVGPTLSSFGVSNVLADPLLTLFGPAGVIATNDDWQTTLSGQPDGSLVAATAARVGAFALPNGSKDAALLATVNSGAYAASLLRPNGPSGAALTEIYDTDSVLGARLINVSARVNVSAGEGTLIAGFVIAGNAPKTVLVRGVGPTLSSFAVPGVLADPTIAVMSGGTLIATNDNWESGPTSAAQISATSSQVGAFALSPGSKDAALLLTLQPGAYTVLVTGVGGTTGVVLVEIYDTP